MFTRVSSKKVSVFDPNSPHPTSSPPLAPTSTPASSSSLRFVPPSAAALLAPIFAHGRTFLQLAICWVVMEAISEYGKQVFWAHVTFLSCTIALELRKLCSLYGNKRHKFWFWERMFYAAVVFHILHSNMINWLWPYSFVVYCIVCLTAHLWQLILVREVFKDINYNAPGYIFLLSVLSIMELLTNISYVTDYFVPMARCTQVVAAMLRVQQLLLGLQFGRMAAQQGQMQVKIKKLQAIHHAVERKLLVQKEKTWKTEQQLAYVTSLMMCTNQIRPLYRSSSLALALVTMQPALNLQSLSQPSAQIPGVSSIKKPISRISSFGESGEGEQLGAPTSSTLPGGESAQDDDTSVGAQRKPMVVSTEEEVLKGGELRSPLSQGKGAWSKNKLSPLAAPTRGVPDFASPAGVSSPHSLGAAAPAGSSAAEDDGTYLMPAGDEGAEEDDGLGQLSAIGTQTAAMSQMTSTTAAHVAQRQGGTVGLMQRLFGKVTKEAAAGALLEHTGLLSMPSGDTSTDHSSLQRYQYLLQLLDALTKESRRPSETEHTVSLLSQSNLLDSETSSVVAPPALDLSAVAAELVAKVQMSLQEVLLHPLACELFKDAVNATCSVENVQFWLAVEHFRLSLKYQPALRTAVADELYEDYIKEGSQYQINISESQRKQIREQIQMAKKTSAPVVMKLFDVAQKEVYRLLATNNWAQFKRTPHYWTAAIWMGKVNVPLQYK